MDRAGFGEKKASVEHVEGSIEIKEPMRYNQTATFTTKSLRLDESRRKTWAGDEYKDKLLGVIVRVFDSGGKLVFEHRDAKTKDMDWPKPGEEAAAIAPAEPKVRIE